MTNFKGERARKNAIFWSTFFKKRLKTPFLACFFVICLRRRKFFKKHGPYTMFHGPYDLNSSELQLGMQNLVCSWEEFCKTSRVF